MRAALVTVTVLVVAGLVAFGVPWRGQAAAPPPSSGSDGFSAGAVAQPGFAIAASRPLARPTATWAPLLRPTAVDAAPDARARVLDRLATRTDDGTTTIVELIGRRLIGGALWLHVRYPSRVPGAAGWVRRSAVGGYTSVDTRLVVSRAALTISLWRGGRVVFRAPIGVGKAGTPTPAGRFYVTDRLTRFADAFYGPIAFGTSALSAVLTDWPGGGQIGIHGTNEPQLIPGRVSHGCIRLRNRDIMALARRLPIGTPVVIR